MDGQRSPVARGGEAPLADRLLAILGKELAAPLRVRLDEWLARRGLSLDDLEEVPEGAQEEEGAEV